MAARRGRARRAGPRRETSWIDAAREVSAATTIGGTRREITLFVPLEDHEGATVIRIVGSIGIWPTVDSAFPQLHAWGIYIAGSGQSGDLNMDPTNAIDIDSEHWMHMRFLFMNKSVSNTTGSNIVYDYAQTAVDIKVMRKVAEGDGIKLVWNATTNYASQATLRLLVKHT